MKKNRSLQLEEESLNFKLILMGLIFFAAFTASLYSRPIKHENICGNGQAWKCANCHERIWQDSSYKNWNGKYHCPKCGAQK